MKSRFSAADLARTGLFAALIIVCTFVTVPLPTGVPLTLQTFAVALGGFLLGPVYGTLAVGVYLLLGAVLSDTNNLTGTTTTEADRRAVPALAELAGVEDPDALYAVLHAEALSYDGMEDTEILW